MATPGEARPDVRCLLSEELDVIRSKIVQEKLVLFIGEQMSTLASTGDPRPSLDDWWKTVSHTEVRPCRGGTQSLSADR